jgi:hypothetical protein
MVMSGACMAGSMHACISNDCCTWGRGREGGQCCMLCFDWWNTCRQVPGHVRGGRLHNNTYEQGMHATNEA